jgi:hypothetical protein
MPALVAWGPRERISNSTKKDVDGRDKPGHGSEIWVDMSWIRSSVMDLKFLPLVGHIA